METHICFILMRRWQNDYALVFQTSLREFNPRPTYQNLMHHDGQVDLISLIRKLASFEY